MREVAPGESHAKLGRRAVVEAQHGLELRQQEIGVRRSGDRDHAVGGDSVSGRDERRETAERVPDHSGEATVALLQRAERLDPVDDVGGPRAGVAVRRRVEGHDPVSLADELAHERCELGGATVPAVGEHDDLAALDDPTRRR